MIETSPEHIALLQSREFWAVDLYAFTFIDDSVIRYSGNPLSTVWGGHTWAGGGPLFKRGSTKQVRGLETDSLTIEITPRDTDMLMDLPFMAAVLNGALDGARVSLYRGHAAKPGGALVGAVLKFQGEIQEVETELAVRLTVKSDLYKLDTPIPLNVYQPGCDRTLYGPGCQVSRATYQRDRVVSSGSSSVVIASGLGESGFYTGGEVRFVSGANSGARRSVKVHSDDQTIQLSYPLLHAVTPGDQFQIWPGCDHTWSECKAKFNNGNAFNGAPFVPSPETAL